MSTELNSGTYNVTAEGYENNSTKLKIVIDHNRVEKIIPEKDIIPNTLEDAVFTQIPEQIVATQSLAVDALTGASHSSKGLIAAVGQAIELAGGDPKDFDYQAQVKHDALKKPTPATNDEKTTYADWRKKPAEITKKIETDFLIIGAGISGLAAAVQAGEEGIQTTVIEKNGFVAGNGGGVEGIFGINTDMQKAAGIHAEKEEIIAREQELGQYRADGSFWVDLVNHSAENIDWLVKQGVQLTKVDDYHGTCAFPTFHWFKGGFASEGYVPYMKKRADELGVKFILNASAEGIIYDGDRAAGAYIATPEGNVEIDAKATLLATGGVGHNPDLIAKQGWQTKNLHYCSMPSNTGDGYMMAMSLGAKDMLTESAEFMMNYIQALPHEGVHLYIDPINGFMSLPSGGPVVFVNQDGVRLVNENVKKDNLLYQRMAIKSTKVTYEVFSQKIYDQITAGVPGADDVLAKAVQTNEGDSLYKADNFEDLAKAVGLPVDSLVKTLQQYNRFAANGKDEEFNKDPEMLVALDEGPFYIARLDPSNLIGIGGVASNRQFEVIKDDFEKIPGLYVSGMDSTMQYRSVYTITLGGSACAHNVNSGRHAAINAKQYMATLNN